MITNISIEKLRPHPNNPRKDLGDLTELSESIKANGIFQNLTVVPNDHDTYTVIIGHRRMAASQLAGLTELPCAIVEMSEKEQLGTMLLENMQRSDLTIYEQAQGFQLMLDLGESVESIAEKTGFGKSTIYKRVKLCQLDKEKFMKAQKRGATLEDYAKLDKITDPELKNRALDSIGTVNFENAVRTAVDDEKYNAKLEKWKSLFSTFAAEITALNNSKYEYVNSVYMTDSAYQDFKIPDDADKVDYFYSIGVNRWDREYIKLYKEKTKSSLQEANEQAQKRRREEERLLRNQKLKELAASFSNARAEFIKNYSPSVNTAIAKFLKIVDFYVVCTNDDWNSLDGYNRLSLVHKICELIGFDFLTNAYKFQECDDLSDMLNSVPDFGEQVHKNIEKFMLACLFLNFEVDYYGGFGNYIRTWNSYNEHIDLSEKEDKYLGLLENLGYQLSDEERSLYDGTHELYKEEDEEELIDVADMPDLEEDE